MIAAACASLLAWFDRVPMTAWVYGWCATAAMVVLVMSAMLTAGARADERGASAAPRRRAWDREP